jgi:hypothetical protein
MPYEIVKVSGGFKVINKDTGKVHAKKTSKKNAQAQIRLMEGIDHGSIMDRDIHKPSARSVRNYGRR